MRAPWALLMGWLGQSDAEWWDRWLFRRTVTPLCRALKFYPKNKPVTILGYHTIPAIYPWDLSSMRRHVFFLSLSGSELMHSGETASSSAASSRQQTSLYFTLCQPFPCLWRTGKKKQKKNYGEASFSCGGGCAVCQTSHMSTWFWRSVSES